MRENHDESVKLYADFSKVAEENEFAWNSGRADGEEIIGTVGEKNRMICFPCLFSIVEDRYVKCLLTPRSAAHERI